MDRVAVEKKGGCFKKLLLLVPLLILLVAGGIAAVGYYKRDLLSRIPVVGETVIKGLEWLKFPEKPKAWEGEEEEEGEEEKETDEEPPPDTDAAGGVPSEGDAGVKRDEAAGPSADDEIPGLGGDKRDLPDFDDGREATPAIDDDAGIEE